MLRLGMEEDIPIESRLITKRIAAAQKAVEAQNFAARKHLLEYDDVMNKQREAIYGWRRQLLEREDQKERIADIIRGILGEFLDNRMPPKAHPSTWDLTGLQTDVLSEFGVKIDIQALAQSVREEIEETIYGQLTSKYEQREQLVGPEVMRGRESLIMLDVIDSQWKDHLLSMDHLKEGIGLRGYGQKDPLVEYKKESFILFQEMMDRIEDEAIRYLFFLQAVEGMAPPLPFGEEEPIEEEEELQTVAVSQQRAAAQATIEDFTRNIQRKKDKELAELQFVGGDSSSSSQKTVVKGAKVGRNEPCPCGSGKKYKKCCGA
jgi:preprotein translocase subunit SecA